MEPTLLLAHTEEDGTLAKPALEALSAALALGGELTVGLVGSQVQPAAAQVASTGARILAVTGAAYAQPRYATDADAAEALCRAANASLVELLAATLAVPRRAVRIVHGSTSRDKIVQVDGLEAATCRRRLDAALTVVDKGRSRR